MRIVPMLLLLPALLVGCGSSPTPPKAEEKPTPVAKKKDTPRSDHVLEDVKDAPTYGDGMLRTLNGAKEVRKTIDKQAAERNQMQKDAESNTDEH